MKISIEEIAHRTLNRQEVDLADCPVEDWLIMVLATNGITDIGQLTKERLESFKMAYPACAHPLETFLRKVAEEEQRQYRAAPIEHRAQLDRSKVFIIPIPRDHYVSITNTVTEKKIVLDPWNVSDEVADENTTIVTKDEPSPFGQFLFEDPEDDEED